jgi:penicillin-binding protein 1A
LEERQGKRVAIEHLKPSAWPEFLQRATGLERKAVSGEPTAPQAGDCFQALVGPDREDDLKAGPFTFHFSPPEAEAGKPAWNHPLAAGDVMRVCLQADGRVQLDPHPWAEGAALVMENATGRVLALVGGYNVGLEGFIRATQARRQPGSSFKPYIYASALARGHTQLDTVLDAPLSLPAGNGKVWSPKNYGGRFFGALPMRKALAMSLNSVAVRLALEDGPTEVARLAQAMGVRSPLRSDLTLALGSSEVTPLDQTVGYATIARMGVPTEPVFIDGVDDLHGNDLGHWGGLVVVDGQPVAKLPGGPQPRALSAGVAYELADMMREVVHSGTARAAYKEGYDRAGKTGTTNDSVDAWFVGFTPRYTVAVWIGTDGQYSLGEKETGGRAALPAWMKIVDALPQPAGERFAIPEEVAIVPAASVGAWVGVARGKIPSSVLRTPPPTPAPLPYFAGQTGPAPSLSTGVALAPQ